MSDALEELKKTYESVEDSKNTDAVEESKNTDAEDLEVVDIIKQTTGNKENEFKKTEEGLLPKEKNINLKKKTAPPKKAANTNYNRLKVLEKQHFKQDVKKKSPNVKKVKEEEQEIVILSESKKDTSQDTKEEPINYDEPDQSKGDFYCRLCDCHMNTYAIWETHISGKRHKKNLNKAPNEIPSKVRFNSSKQDSLLYEKLNDFSGPIVGLSYVTEFRRLNSLEPTYTCFLCQGTQPLSQFAMHVTSTKHRLAYIKKEDPEGASMISALRFKGNALDNVVEERSGLLMNKHGQGKIEVKIEKGEEEKIVQKPADPFSKKSLNKKMWDENKKFIQNKILPFKRSMEHDSRSENFSSRGSPTLLKPSYLKSSSRFKNSRSRSPLRFDKSKSRSPLRYKRTPSRSPPRYKRTPSRSPPRYKRTPSRSPPRYKRAPSRSPPRYKRTPSRSPPRYKRTSSKSPSRFKGSLIRSSTKFADPLGSKISDFNKVSNSSLENYTTDVSKRKKLEGPFSQQKGTISASHERFLPSTYPAERLQALPAYMPGQLPMESNYDSLKQPVPANLPPMSSVQRQNYLLPVVTSSPYSNTTQNYAANFTPMDGSYTSRFSNSNSFLETSNSDASKQNDQDRIEKIFSSLKNSMLQLSNKKSLMERIKRTSNDQKLVMLFILSGREKNRPRQDNECASIEILTDILENLNKQLYSFMQSVFTLSSLQEKMASRCESESSEMRSKANFQTQTLTSLNMLTNNLPRTETFFRNVTSFSKLSPDFLENTKNKAEDVHRAQCEAFLMNKTPVHTSSENTGVWSRVQESTSSTYAGHNYKNQPFNQTFRPSTSNRGLVTRNVKDNFGQNQFSEMESKKYFGRQY